MENNLLLGGCSSKTPCINSSVFAIAKSFAELFLPISLSNVPTSLDATFHSNLSCSLKNSRNAASSLSSQSCLRDGVGTVDDKTMADLRLSAAEVREGAGEASMTERRLSATEVLGLERHSCARTASIWRRPRIRFSGVMEERLSKAWDNRSSMMMCSGKRVVSQEHDRMKACAAVARCNKTTREQRAEERRKKKGD